MIHHFEAVSAAIVAAGTGVVGGAVLVANLADASVGTWIGGLIGGAVVVGGAAAFKNWAEDIVSKFIEMPTKKEIFDRIDAVGDQVKQLHEFYRNEIGPLRERVARIEERHATIDRENQNGARD